MVENIYIIYVSDLELPYIIWRKIFFSGMRNEGFSFYFESLGVEPYSLDVVFVFATVRKRPQVGPYGHAYGDCCKGGCFWRFQTSCHLVSFGRRGTSLWHPVWNLFWHSTVSGILSGRYSGILSGMCSGPRLPWHDLEILERDCSNWTATCCEIRACWCPQWRWAGGRRKEGRKEESRLSLKSKVYRV